MRFLTALAVNLWLAGFPTLFIAGAALALLRRAPGRFRYAVALAGFAAVVLVPLLATREGAPRLIGAAGSAARAAAGGPDSALDSGALLAGLWIGVAVLLLARELVAHLRLTGQSRRWRLADETLREALGVPDGRRLRLADVPSPRTHGLLVPAILLPDRLAEALDPTVVRLIAAHEEAHARWRDPLVQAVVRVLRSLFWVAPPVWIAERLIVREREAAADEAALGGAGAEVCARYAAALVDFARVRARRLELVAVGLGPASDLEYRIRRILRLSPARTAGIAAAVLGLASGSLALAVAPLAEVPGRTLVVAGGGRDRGAPPARGAAAGAAIAPPGMRAAPAPSPGAAAASPSIEGQRLRQAASAPRATMPELAAPAVPAAETPGERAASASAPLDGAPEVGAALADDSHRDVAMHRNVDARGDADAHRDVDVHRESPPASGSGDGAAGDGAERRVIVDRIVIRTPGDGTRRHWWDGNGRGKHPVALFHRAVTAPMKRWLRGRSEPPPAPSPPP